MADGCIAALCGAPPFSVPSNQAMWLYRGTAVWALLIGRHVMTKKFSCEWMCLCEMTGCSKVCLGEITRYYSAPPPAYLYPWTWWIWVMKRSSLTDIHMIASHALKGHRAPQSSPPQPLIWLPCEISHPQISLACKSGACALAQNRMEILTCLPS